MEEKGKMGEKSYVLCKVGEKGKICVDLERMGIDVEKKGGKKGEGEKGGIVKVTLGLTREEWARFVLGVECGKKTRVGDYEFDIMLFDDVDDL